MRQVILFIAASLDGYIARTSGEVDWLFTDQDYGYNQFFAGVDTVLVGRKTYEQALSFEAIPFPVKHVYVFSKTAGYQDSESVHYISSGIEKFVADLKNQSGETIWLVGGSEIIQPCLEQNLIDEFVLSIHPIVLGGGIPLFRNLPEPKKLLLQSCERFDTGLVQLTYRRQNTLD